MMDLTLFKNAKVFDYSIPYMPKKESMQFFSWVHTNLPEEQFKTPKTHYMLIDEVLGKETQVEAICHREFAKSTVLTKFIPLNVAQTGQLMNFGKITNVAIFSATYTQAVALLASVRGVWESSPELYSTISLAKKRNGRSIADKDNRVCFQNSMGNIVDISCYGSGDAIRGAKIKDENGQEKRLQLLLFDDILKDNILTSEKEREKLLNWYVNTVMPAVDSSHHKEIVLGTPMHMGDLLMVLAQGKEYKTVFFPIAMKFPVPENEIVSSWPKLHTPKNIMRSYALADSIGQADGWVRERMLRVVSESMRVFQKSNNRNYSYQILKRDFEDLLFFTSIDMAISIEDTADFTCVATIGVSSKNEWFLVDIKHGRVDPSTVIDWIFEQVTKFNPINVSAEKAALQQVLNHFLEKEMEKRKKWFNLVPLQNNSKDSKHNRIIGLAPRHSQGKIMLPTDICQDSVMELKSEMYGYIKTGSTTERIDLLDCLANFNDTDLVFAPMNRGGSEVSNNMIDDTFEFVDRYNF